MLCGLGDRNLRPLDAAVESVATWAVVRRDRGTRILSDVATVVAGEYHRQCHADVPFANFLAVNVEDYLAALAEATASVRELHAELVISRGQRAFGLDVEVPDTPQIVAVLQLAALRVEAPAADVRALGDDHALSARLKHLDLCSDGMRLVLDVEDTVLRQAPHAAEKDLGSSLDQHRSTSKIRVHLLREIVVERQNVVAHRLYKPKALQLAELLGHLFGEVVRLAPVLGGVVEFPDVVVEGQDFLADQNPRCLVPRHRGPALVVNAAVAKHLEVLRLVPFRCLAVIERVEHADALNGLLLHAVD